MTEFEQAVADALVALYDKQMDYEPTAHFAEWVAPRVAAAIEELADHGAMDGGAYDRSRALAALRGDAP